MSEESKTPDSDYVHMGDGRGYVPGGVVKIPDGLDDPNLSQEDRDMRLALALQQQENAAAYDAHKKQHDTAVAAHNLRTARSNTQTRLTDIRRKDHGMLKVPADYSTENAYVSGGDGGDLRRPCCRLTWRVSSGRCRPQIGCQPPEGRTACCRHWTGTGEDDSRET